MSFLANASRARAASQLQRTDAREVQNSEGAYVYPVDGWERLERFLLLGTAGGTYYADQRTLTDENAFALAQLVREDGARVVARAVAISEAGRAAKQAYALFALALALASDDAAARTAAYAAIPRVCRTASALFQLLSYVRGRRGWSRGLRSAIARWYNARPVDVLAYQLVKYQSRHGYTHRDLLRLAHPDPHRADLDAEVTVRDALYRKAAGKDVDVDLLPTIVRLAEAAKSSNQAERTVFARALPREALPTEWLTDPAVWEALLYGGDDGRGMPLTALLRNLATMTRVGLLTAGSDAARYVAGVLSDADRLHRARVHPVALYLAKATYGSGRSVRGSAVWAPVGAVEDALMGAFELTLPNVVPTGKRIVLAVDTSGSMGSRGVLGYPSVTAAELSVVMAFVSAKAEPNLQLLSFDTEVEEVLVSGDATLERFVARFPHRGGGTDCALPFLWALQRKAGPDAVVTFTDNETWAGNTKVVDALAALRRSTGTPVKALTAAVTATRNAVVDPADPLALGISGFDAAVPQLIADFVGAP
jgi:60 kDa SS-A/Ro ribonucleoprotein